MDNKLQDRTLLYGYEYITAKKTHHSQIVYSDMNKGDICR